MKWPRWRKEPCLDHLPSADLEAASSAEELATERLAEVKNERTEISRLAERLRELRRENHFAEKIQATFSERHE